MLGRNLVSVIISTYNSSAFIIETLESILNQSWKEIELIITDDCSVDNTIEVCAGWIEENQQRFSGAEIIKSDINTGVSANANRGLKRASGTWVKFLGADDTLTPDCISHNIQYIAENPHVKVLFSKVNIYRDRFDKTNLIETTPEGEISENSIVYPEKTAESQYRMLLLNDRIHFSPSVFLNRETLLSVGGFDERFRLLEDYPLWLNLTQNGHKLFFMDKVTVNYRRHSKAINNTGITNIVNPNYFRSEEFRRIYTYPNLPVDVRLYQRYNWYASQIFRIRWFNRDKQVFRVLNSLLTLWMNPFRYLIYFRKKINKRIRENEFYV